MEKIKNFCYDLFDEYGDIDESTVDNEGKFSYSCKYFKPCGTNEV